MNSGILLKISSLLQEFSSLFFFHSVEILFLIWTILILFILLISRTMINIYQLGMISITKHDARFEQTNDGKKKKKNLLKYISYDNPVNKILFIRILGIIGFYGITIFSSIIFILSFIIISFYFLKMNKIINMKYTYFYLFSEYNMYGIVWIIFSFLISFSFYLVIYHKIIKTYFSNLDKKINEEMIEQSQKSDLRSGGLLDVKNLKFNDVDIYDPFEYFEDAKNKNSLFLGKDDNDEPIFYDKDIWNETNVQIIGKMGSGKGVLATTVFLQCYLNFNDLNIWFDPKNDEWAYSVFKNSIKNSDFFYIDLNRDAPPQFNIFDGITPTELNELFVAGFGLGRSGNNADFYRLGDRKACRELANKFEGVEQININSIMEMWLQLPNNLKEQATNFFGQLEELSELKCIQSNSGLKLKDIITQNRGGMLYITGALRDENVVMLQKMLLLRITQIIEKRDRKNELKHINIMLDEVRYSLSRNTLEMMGTIRDKKANIIYSHQSLGDLVGTSQDLDPLATKNVMLDNVGLRWIYKLDLLDSAKWASDLTSETLKDVERRTLSLNDANIEMASKETTIFKQKANYIETSVIQNLPKRCGVLIGLEGLPKLAYSSPVLVKKLDKVIVEASGLDLTFKKAIRKNNITQQHENHLKKESNKVDESLLGETEGLKAFLANKNNRADEIFSNVHEQSIDNEIIN